MRQSLEFLSNKVISTNSDFTHMELQKGKVCNLIKHSLAFSTTFSSENTLGIKVGDEDTML